MAFGMNLKRIFEHISDGATEQLASFLESIVDGVRYEGDRVIYVEEPDDSQSYVDLSVNNNPYEPEVEVIDCNGISYEVLVYSIFRRYKDDVYSDANPLVYALKNERGWKISKGDRNILYGHLREIAKKVVKDIPHDITLLMPSSNRLNEYFAKELEKGVGDFNIYANEFIEKRSSNEVLEELRTPTSAFFKYYHKGGEKEYREKVKEFLRYKDDMGLNHFGKFTYHSVKDDEMRNLISNSMKVVDSDFQEASELLNGRNVLILDDSVSRGKTIVDAVKAIGELYVPKSITILTLFSKSYEV